MYVCMYHVLDDWPNEGDTSEVHLLLFVACSAPSQLAHFKALYLEAIRLPLVLDHSSLTALTALSSSADLLKHSTQ